MNNDLEVVMKNGLDLEHIEIQTEEVCVEAVKQNWHALKFVHVQTDAVQLEAVMHNQMAYHLITNPGTVVVQYMLERIRNPKVMEQAIAAGRMTGADLYKEAERRGLY